MVICKLDLCKFSVFERTLCTLSYHIVLFIVCGFRLFHVDDIPSGMGGDALDFNKATAVGGYMLFELLRFK